MSKPIHLYQLDINPAIEQHLLSLTQRHMKLAVEHSRCQTSHVVVVVGMQRIELRNPLFPRL
ncbi:hypothetical protein [Paenibacillus radicis (ex Gao et al. 2016)]|uniref:Uncharacterized protein n=1 Tax=Paenibacillus radicis (ex Gao et al. 2016) TaxID=1737354 RepID=A0A917HT87_9BACL|nr:hypothetical protein [Paenibacillus radicis (ex Gao et al. 2016)]GGG88647.1 hypothetical protein GCM10010918_54060 [Paenibacillus radicis (ex Gao et al. 2016)]